MKKFFLCAAFSLIGLAATAQTTRTEAKRDASVKPEQMTRAQHRDSKAKMKSDPQSAVPRAADGTLRGTNSSSRTQATTPAGATVPPPRTGSVSGSSAPAGTGSVSGSATPSGTAMPAQ